jgi:hypothetical protein
MTRDALLQALVDRLRNVARRALSPAALGGRPFVALIAVLPMWACAPAPATGVHAAASYTVTATQDEDDANACGHPALTSGTGPDGHLSLREAICEANNAGGAQTISVPAGTFNLANVGTVELQVGSASGANITITGAGASSTIIHQTIANQRVFDLDVTGAGNVTVDISDVTISGGTGTTFGGGGILAGGTGDNTTLDHDIITGNTTSGGNQGGGISYGGGGNLTITNSTIANNISDLLGGGIAFNQTGNDGNLTISSSLIFSNTVTNAGGGGGGGLAVTGNNTIAITSSAFANNTLSGGHATDQHGGAIEIEGGILNLSLSRIVGNTAGNGTGLYVAGGATAHATNNWWGCNGGPGAAGCDDAQGPGTHNTSPYLKLTLTADSTHPDPQTSTLVHATTTINSNGVDISGAGHLPDSPTTPNVTFTSTLGTVSPSSVALAAGLANSTYTTGGTSGNGSASATLDHATATVFITVPTSAAIATPTSTATTTRTATPTRTPTNVATSTPTRTPVVLGIVGLVGTPETVATATRTPRPDVLISVQLRRQRRPQRHTAPTLSYQVTTLSHPLRPRPLIAVRITAAPRRRVIVTLNVVRGMSLPADPRHRPRARHTRTVYRTTARGWTNRRGRLYLRLRSVQLSSGHAMGRVTITVQGLRAITVGLTL